MVRESLRDMSNSDSDYAKSVWTAIAKLDTKNLREIKSEKAIRDICFQVITAVETILLVHVNEEELEKRKLKKQKNVPLKYEDALVWNSGARIRVDWTSARWKKNSPHGWIYYNEDKSLLGTIYEWQEKGKYEIFIRKEIAENPHGAFVLLKAMKKRCEKVMKKKGE